MHMSWPMAMLWAMADMHRGSGVEFRTLKQTRFESWTAMSVHSDVNV